MPRFCAERLKRKPAQIRGAGGWDAGPGVTAMRAMANGVKFGRKRKLSGYQRTEAIKRRDAGETLAAVAKSNGVRWR